MNRKFLALVMVCIMLVGCLASCADDTNQPQVTTPQGTTDQGEGDSLYDSNGYLKDSLPELDFDNHEITILTWNPSLDELCLVEEEGVGGLIEDALFRQLTNLEERLNVDVVIRQEPGKQDEREDILQLIETSSNTNTPFDLVGTYSGTGAIGAIRGLFHNLNNVDYIDFDKPWWPEDLKNSIDVNGNMYFASGDISPNLIYGLFAILVNNDMLADLYQDTETIYQLATDGEWTLEQLFNYSRNVYSDLNMGNKDDSDRFGLTISNAVTLDSFLQGCGIDITTKNSSGKIVMSSTFSSQQCDDLVSQLAAFLKTDDCIISKDYAGIFPEGRALFLNGKLEVCITKLTNATFEYGVLPMPKFNTDQKDYVTTMNHNFSVYSIPKALTTDAANRAGAVMEALASSGYRTVAPAIFEMAFKLKYSANPTVSAMYQIVRDSVKFDMGRLYRLNFNSSFIPDTLFRNAVQGDQQWLATISSLKGMWNKTLTEIYDKLK